LAALDHARAEIEVGADRTKCEVLRLAPVGGGDCGCWRPNLWREDAEEGRGGYLNDLRVSSALSAPPR